MSKYGNKGFCYIELTSLLKTAACEVVIQDFFFFFFYVKGNFIFSSFRFCYSSFRK